MTNDKAALTPQVLNAASSAVFLVAVFQAIAGTALLLMGVALVVAASLCLLSGVDLVILRQHKINGDFNRAGND